MNDTAQQVHADAIYAATSATNAADSASAANTAKLAAQQAVTAAEQAGAEQVALAVAARDEAEAFAEAAGAGVPAERTPFTVLQVNAAGQVAWGYGLPDRTNAKAGQSLMLGAGKVPGFGWAGDQVGDLVRSARVMDGRYLPAAGGIYLKSAYPALAAILGSIGDPAGMVWTTLSTAALSSVNARPCTDGNGTWILGNQISRDNGVTWSTITRNIDSAASDGNGVWVGGQGTNLIRSDDNGVNWTTPSGTSSLGESIFNAATNKTGTWLVSGYGSRINRSVDNGVTWSNQAAPGGASGDILWLTGNTFVTASGYITYDGGASWSLIAAARVTVSTYGSAIVKTPSGFLLRENYGVVYLSKDNGLTWNTVASGAYNGGFQKAIACDPNGVVVIGTGPQVLISLDEGKTWSTVATPRTSNSVAYGLGKFISAGNSNPGASASVENFDYDKNTMFKVPNPAKTRGVSSYIKALEAV
ncbi:sialidase family protein [Pseudomonas guariconensis]|uniref:WD40/YVTN/BNR-like repeat-containing protein n=1 Tax=Pseudomonas guariconensis TaxID=1288410 RepID=UPI0025A9811F|nr:sialidase family protein [Pseudomonas guariconensis]MDM9594648.1 sialidase family protein [Pseudomonas guariconensis]MDM9607478.1 sialidase family protein [Pseudomonas guariconensis]MDM9612434.1 sialidase family protein [Pseudomonas guariconensis]